MPRHVRRNLLLGVGLALGAAVIALGRDDDRVAADLGRRDLGPAPAALAAAVLPAAPVAEPAPPVRPHAAVATPPPPRAADGSPTVDLARMELHGDRYLAPMSDGRMAVLTIDPAIQAVAEKVLKRARAPRGAIVVTHPDGRILALAGRRTEDPTGAGDGISDPALALDAWAPSASIFKVVSAAALVEAGVGQHDKVCFHGGLRSVMESNLTDSRRQPLRGPGLRRRPLAERDHRQAGPPAAGARAARRGRPPVRLRPRAGAAGPRRLRPRRDPRPPRASTSPAPPPASSGVELSVVGGALLANTVATGGIAAPPRLIAGFDGDRSARAGRSRPRSATGCSRRPSPTRWRDDGRPAPTAARPRPSPVATSIPGVRSPARPARCRATSRSTCSTRGSSASPRPTKPTLSIAVLLGNPELWQIKAHTAARMVLIEALKSRAGT
jgi:hypothetical protein